MVAKECDITLFSPIVVVTVYLDGHSEALFWKESKLVRSIWQNTSALRLQFETYFYQGWDLLSVPLLDIFSFSMGFS